MALLGLLVGCTAPAAGDAARATDPIVGVDETTLERPEIGHFASCTGALVADNVVLSAAHCFDFRSGVRALGSFTIDLPDKTHRSFPAVEVVVYSAASGPHDLALVRLESSVPADVATPTRLASARPADGERVTMWGYGCTSRPFVPDLGDGRVITAGDPLFGKRKFAYDYPDTTRRGCPGDSGGPRTRANGEVFEVNSAYFRDRDIPLEGPDRQADAVLHHDELTAQIARWNG